MSSDECCNRPLRTMDEHEYGSGPLVTRVASPVSIQRRRLAAVLSVLACVLAAKNRSVERQELGSRALRQLRVRRASNADQAE